MNPKASVIIAVYNGLRALELVLSGYSRQSFPEFEVVIADDGSGPEMPAFIESFSRRCPFPMQYVNQEDRGFRKCRILNQGIRVSSAPYLIFADADCIPHANFVRAHLDCRAARTVLCGRRMNLSPRMSQELTPQDVLSGKLDRITPLLMDALLGRSSHLEEAIAIRNKTLRNWVHRATPTLVGCNFSVEKSLIEEVNGFNEDFIDYWGEDTELGYRLHRAGARFEWIRHHAIQYHIDHPPRSKTERSCTLLEQARVEGAVASRNGLRKPVEPAEIIPSESDSSDR